MQCQLYLFLVLLLQLFYILGDKTASTNVDQCAVDQRIIDLIDMEDYDIVFDLRAHNGKRGTKHDVFWDECQKFLNEEEAADDHRHGAITHLARAISISDFDDQVYRVQL